MSSNQMGSNEAVSRELLREVIREVVREVIREVIAEEVAAAAGKGALAPSPTAARLPQAQAGSAQTTFTRGALTERHVRAAGPTTTIRITRAVVVTPLAKERAKAMGVDIIRIEE